MKLFKFIPHFYQSSTKLPRAYCSNSNEFVQDFQYLGEQKKKHWEYHQKELGKVYSVKPIKVRCKKGNIYLWCSCGHSKSQVI